MRNLLAILLVSVLAAATHAQDRPASILVLDGSNSMWGQIDGVAKITIAQDVVGQLLQSLPADQQLGLTVYGHRRKGDCSDIETVVAPGPDTRDAIARAVNAVSPRGKTPITDAIIAAAKALSYEQNPATVILVSDGVETCNPDPCAAAAALEAAGADFTAHVIGFDIGGDPDALAQMQCIADATGGRFLTAANANELTAALTATVAAPAPASVTITAIEGENGPTITQGLTWSLSDDAGNVIYEDFVLPEISLALVPANYRVEVARSNDGARATADFVVESEALTLRLVLPEIVEPVEIRFRAVLETDNSYIDDGLTWAFSDNAAAPATDPTGPIAREMLPGAYNVTVTRAQDGASASTDFTVADAPHTVVLKLPEIPRSASLTAVDTAPIGATISVAWTADEGDDDFIAIWDPDHRGVHRGYVDTDGESPAALRLPLDPGDYEIVYVFNNAGQRDRVLATHAINVTEITATVTAPAAAAAGSDLDVTWRGPDYDNDYIAIADPDAPAGTYAGYTYTNNGNPLTLRLPVEPGSYELRYVANGSPDRILGSAPIEVFAQSATLDAAAQAIAGSFVDVTWSGPDNQNDYISVADADAGPGEYRAYAYTNAGTPAAVRMPLDPGEYELRYVANGSPDKVLATRPISVAAAAVSLVATDDAPVGAVVDVNWQGPDNQGDYIAVATPDSPANKYVNYAYTSNGTPAEVTMPIEPGSYELRYVANGSPDQVLASRPITIAAVTVSVEAVDQAVAGSAVDVAWIGPDNRGDYISVAVPDAKDNQYEGYAYTANGNPATVIMPLVPGTYEMRYVANGAPDTAMARRPIQIVAAEITLAAPPDAVAGAPVEVSWQGPDNQGDFISVSAADDGANTYFNYAYTRNGSPAVIDMPVTPGTYQIRYVGHGSPSKVLSSTTIDVAPVTATLSAAATAPAGSEIEVTWTGPDYRNDYIAIAPAAGGRYLTYTYTRTGNPVTVKLPDTPGAYVLQYTLNQGNTVIVTLPLTAE